MSAFSKYEQLEIAARITAKLLHYYINFMFNNIAIEDINANISSIGLIREIIAI